MIVNLFFSLFLFYKKSFYYKLESIIFSLFTKNTNPFGKVFCCTGVFFFVHITVSQTVAEIMKIWQQSIY